MAKRERLEIIKDILEIIRSNRNKIKITPLLRKSNISSSRFKKYYKELLEGKFLKEIRTNNGKFISLTEKGNRFLEKYQTIINFIEEFEI
jgi:predicted transcriptional regulator